jgi:FkbM family methyltransferase
MAELEQGMLDTANRLCESGIASDEMGEQLDVVEDRRRRFKALENVSSFFDDRELAEIATQLGIGSNGDGPSEQGCTPLNVSELIQKVSADRRTRELLCSALEGRIPHTPARLHLRIGKRKYIFQVPVDSRDAVCSMLEVLGYGIYEHACKAVEQVLDLGAHIGLSTIYLHSMYGEASFTCVEPSRENCEYLAINLRNNPLIKAELVQGAIGASTETAMLGVKPGVAMTNSTVFRQAYGTWEAVPGVRLRHLVRSREYGIKMDIEGAEYYMYNDANILAGAQWIVGELHYGMFSKPADKWLKKLLEDEFDFQPQEPRANVMGGDIVIAQNFTAFKVKKSPLINRCDL